MSDTPLWFEPPPPPSQPPERPSGSPPAMVTLDIDGRRVEVPEDFTLLRATRLLGIDTPTLCFLENLVPASVCRLCVVELAGSRTLVPSCSRKVAAGMVVRTSSERVRLARRLILELLGASVDLSVWPAARAYMDEYGARPERFDAVAVAEEVMIDNELFVRDYAKCVLCHKCVQACGALAQNTFAIAVSGRGVGARIATEWDVPLPRSACVFCGNCIGVCPTGALMSRSEHELRAAGTWDEARQKTTHTICGYCGVGCPLTLHVQDERIVKVTSPITSDITRGHLCIKGRFGFAFVNG